MSPSPHFPLTLPIPSPFLPSFPPLTYFPPFTLTPSLTSSLPLFSPLTYFPSSSFLTLSPPRPLTSSSYPPLIPSLPPLPLPSHSSSSLFTPSTLSPSSSFSPLTLPFPYIFLVSHLSLPNKGRREGRGKRGRGERKWRGNEACKQITK